MPAADRLTVRFAYQRGFQVVDGSAILQTFEKQDEAKFVLGRGARVWLAWQLAGCRKGGRLFCT
ncbi:hypothetical protein NKI15_12360 [Mesorhizobium sp. M0862]|uniref:hypothetical protein n=1 Tax=Mesorhizobium sp. M0862 TaxID=2957015 RepID=UPI0033360084